MLIASSVTAHLLSGDDRTMFLNPTLV